MRALSLSISTYLGSRSFALVHLVQLSVFLSKKYYFRCLFKFFSKR
jgi:hypothetical protein